MTANLDLSEELERLDRVTHALGAANEGLIAALQSGAVLTAAGVGDLLDILLDELKACRDAIAENLDRPPS